MASQSLVVVGMARDRVAGCPVYVTWSAPWQRRSSPAAAGPGDAGGTAHLRVAEVPAPGRTGHQAGAASKPLQHVIDVAAVTASLAPHKLTPDRHPAHYARRGRLAGVA